MQTNARQIRLTTGPHRTILVRYPSERHRNAHLARDQRSVVRISSGSGENVTVCQRWSIGGSGQGRAIQVPERRPPCARLEEHVVGFCVAVEISGTLECPADR